MRATHARILLICISTVLGMHFSVQGQVFLEHVEAQCWCRLTEDGGLTLMDVGATGQGPSETEACQDCHQNITSEYPNHTIVECDPCSTVRRTRLQVPYQAIPVQPVLPIARWKVAFTCQTNRNPISFTATGSTFCEAYNTARTMVCNRVRMKNLVCCKASYVIKQRPCDCCNRPASSNGCAQPLGMTTESRVQSADPVYQVTVCCRCVSNDIGLTSSCEGMGFGNSIEEAKQNAMENCLCPDGHTKTDCAICSIRLVSYPSCVQPQGKCVQPMKRYCPVSNNCPPVSKSRFRIFRSR